MIRPLGKSYRKHNFRGKTRQISITKEVYSDLKALAIDFKDIKKTYWVSRVLQKAIIDERVKRQMEGSK